MKMWMSHILFWVMLLSGMHLYAQFVKDFTLHKRKLSDPTAREQIYMNNLREMGLHGKIRSIEQISYTADYEMIDSVMSFDLNTQTDLDSMTFRTKRELKKKTSLVPGWPDARLTFDEQGNTTSLEIIMGEEELLVKKFEMAYDQENNLIRKKYYLLPDIIEAQYEYRYDDQNRMVVEIKYDGEGQIIWSHRNNISLDDKGRVIKVKSFYQEKGKAPVREKKGYNYDEKEQLVTEKFYDKNDKKYREITLEMNDLGLVKEKKWKDKKTNGTHKYSYNDRGQIIKEKFLWWRNLKYASRIKEYTYNSHGVLMETQTQSDFEHYKDDYSYIAVSELFKLGLALHGVEIGSTDYSHVATHMPGIIRREVFTYDLHGNWTTLELMDKVLFSRNPEEEDWILRNIIERKIQYYPEQILSSVQGTSP